MPDYRPRFKMLINQLADEHGRKDGRTLSWRATADFQPYYVAKVLNDELGAIGEGIIDRACQSLGIMRTYFTGEAEPEHWRDYAINRNGHHLFKAPVAIPLGTPPCATHGSARCEPA